jgi:hypothetical protein
MKLKSIIFSLLFCTFGSLSNAQEITLFAGFFALEYYEDDLRIPRQVVDKLMQKDAVANMEWLKFKKHEKIVWLAIVGQIAFGSWMIYNDDRNKDIAVPQIGFIGSSVTGIGFAISSNNARKRAILKYNKSFDTASIKLGTTSDGVGLVFGF